MVVTRKLKRPVLQLFTQCLRSARRCPQWEQREMMKVYVRTRFRDAIKIQDPDRVLALLADGRDELERMNYYHSMYETKQKQAKSTAGQGSEHDARCETERPHDCPQCQASYLSEQANFCANCGTKRPERS